jgi:twinkle protein
MNIKDYLKKWAWAYKEAPDDELQVKICPFCGKEDEKFYINYKTGMWLCHHASCGQSGSWYKLLREIGETLPIREVFSDSEDDEDKIRKFATEHARLEEAHEKIFADKEAIAWLKGKGIGEGTIRDFKIGVGVDRGGDKWISLPYLREGRLTNAKYRTITGRKRFRRLPGGLSVLYNEENVTKTLGPKRILICEGESDTLAAHSAGIKWVAGVTVGSKGINPEWIDQLDRFERIYIAFDSDIAGRQGAHELARRLGYERCFNVQLPLGIEDVSEFFAKGHSKDDFLERLRKAKHFGMENIITVRDAFKQIAEELKLRGSLYQGIQLPWINVSKKMGGLLSGDLVVLTGVPGVGKTTFALNVAYHFAHKLGIPTLFFCMEMRPERLARKVMSLHLEKDDKFIKEEDVKKAWEDFRQTPIYLGYSYRDLTMEKLTNTIREAVRRFGIGFVVFDHIHFLCRSIQHMTEEVGAVIREFKMLAEDEGIPICVLSHTRKVGTTSKGQFHVPNMMDLRNTGMLAADADFVVVLHRNRIQVDEESEMYIFDNNTLVRLEKARYEEGGDSFLVYEGEKSLFVEMKG